MNTLELFVAVMGEPARSRCALYAPYFEVFAPIYEITTPHRIAAFLGTIAEESGALMYTRELWGPTPAQERYEPPHEKAAELGNTEPGDGYRFRGRGLIQITGRANYQTASDALGHDFVSSPDSVRSPDNAMQTACWWWKTHGCNELADVPDFEAVTRRVNGGLTHYDRRKAYYDRALAALQEKTDAHD